jgi:uracil-DNA glycosylase family 4
MALELDERQRAMLREMGVAVWLPSSTKAEAASPDRAAPARTVRGEEPPSRRSAEQAVKQPEVVVPVNHAVAESGAHSLRLGPWQSLVGGDAASVENADDLPLWLLLVESPLDDLRAGDAGRLLANMLRATGLGQGVARVVGAAVDRTGAAVSDGTLDSAPSAQARQQLEHAVGAQSPVVILAMGRLAFQLALGSTEPLGRLRAVTHRFGRVPVVPTYAPTYLLRVQQDKARAWDDLCRARTAAHAVPIAS